MGQELNNNHKATRKVNERAEPTERRETNKEWTEGKGGKKKKLNNNTKTKSKDENRE